MTYLLALQPHTQEKCHGENGRFADQCINRHAQNGIIFCRSEFFAGRYERYVDHRLLRLTAGYRAVPICAGRQHVDSLRILTTSGSTTLDAAALETVSASLPFYPPPHSLPITFGGKS